jgi:hypothetical protein
MIEDTELLYPQQLVGPSIPSIGAVAVKPMLTVGIIVADAVTVRVQTNRRTATTRLIKTGLLISSNKVRKRLAYNRNLHTIYTLEALGLIPV